MRGIYSKYHNIVEPHNCTGFIDFNWDDNNKRYNIDYVYSVRKKQENSDLVTAICSGFALCDSIGDIKKIRIYLYG